MIELTDTDKKIIDRISEITLTDYKTIMLKEEWYIHRDDLLNALEDMKYEYEHIKEEYRDYQDQIQDNYKLIPLEREEY